jgi:ElaB/YqjD/DUF883 family membrane-anchored ribosome-binding protein
VPNKTDEVAADLDDLSTDVEELHDESAGHDADQLEKVERALEDAKDAIDGLDGDEGEGGEEEKE